MPVPIRSAEAVDYQNCVRKWSIRVRGWTVKPAKGNIVVVHCTIGAIHCKKLAFVTRE